MRAAVNSFPQEATDLGTATSNRPLKALDTPTPISALAHTADVSQLVSIARTLNDDVRVTYLQTIDHEWKVRKQNRASIGVKDLLELLADQGFAWRDVARMIGVSVPAIQKWRKGEKASGDNRSKLTSLVAAQDLISTHFHIQDVESWFEMPIVEGVPLTPIDVWASGQHYLVLEYASSHLDPELALNRFDPDWRENYQSNFESFIGEDGHRSIAVKE